MLGVQVPVKFFWHWCASYLSFKLPPILHHFATFLSSYLALFVPTAHLLSHTGSVFCPLLTAIACFQTWNRPKPQADLHRNVKRKTIKNNTAGWRLRRYPTPRLDAFQIYMLALVNPTLGCLPFSLCALSCLLGLSVSDWTASFFLLNLGPFGPFGPLQDREE